MANKVTGTTDTSGAMSTQESSKKSLLIVGTVTGTPMQVVSPNTLFKISGTADVAAKFGDSSDLVKVSKILITNGVSNIYGVIAATPSSSIAEDPPQQSGLANSYESALVASLGEKSIKCIVLDTEDTAVITVLKTHLDGAEKEDMFRYGVVSTAKTQQNELITFAKSIDNKRVFVVGPAVIDNEATKLGPVFAATGLASLIMTETSDPALPMNSVKILGLGGVDRTVLESERSILANSGITALYNDNGSPTVHRLVTSCTENNVWQEGTTLFIADYVLETIEEFLRENYKRTKGVARILNSIKSDVKGILESLQALEIIENFNPATLTVVKDPEDIYGALVDYEFDVVTPLYTITINQHMKL